MRFDTACCTARGGRETNQDAVRQAVSGRVALWALADGLGGFGGGEIASATAADALLRAFGEHAEASAEALRTYFEVANRAVVARQPEQPEWSAMRTTLVALLIGDAGAWWAYSGDSRLYHFRGGAVAFQTQDHSVPQLLVASGRIAPAEVRGHPDRNRLLKSLGNPGGVDATIQTEPRAVEPGDAFLLASDGFWEHVLEREMEADYAKSAAAADWLDRMTARLRARAAGDYDNYSAIAIWVTCL
jgi:serine/threonine protein phosphatase PrpC